jgi:hypothetical protein
MSIDDCDAAGRHIAYETRCTIVLVDYRFAPEHLYPAAIDNVWLAPEWADRHREALSGTSHASLIVAGVGALNLTMATGVDPVVDASEPLLKSALEANGRVAALFTASAHGVVASITAIEEHQNGFVKNLESPCRIFSK